MPKLVRHKIGYLIYKLAVKFTLVLKYVSSLLNVDVSPFWFGSRSNKDVEFLTGNDKSLKPFSNRGKVQISLDTLKIKL